MFILNCTQQISHTMPAVLSKPKLREYDNFISLQTQLSCSYKQTGKILT